MNSKRERTEAGDRPGLDESSKYKGIARHPLARRWLRRCYQKARRAGDVQTGARIKVRMKRLGMKTEVR